MEQGQLELTLGTQHKVPKNGIFVMINSYELHQLQSIGEYRIYSSRTGISSRHALFFLSRSESAVFSEAAAVSSTWLPSHVSEIIPAHHLFAKHFWRFFMIMIPYPWMDFVFKKQSIPDSGNSLFLENLLVQTTVQDSQGKTRKQYKYKQILPVYP